jgi:hypothetical protein
MTSPTNSSAQRSGRWGDSSRKKSSSTERVIGLEAPIPPSAASCGANAR